MTSSRREFLGATAGLAAGTFSPYFNSPAHAEEPPAIVDCHTHFYDPSRPQGVPWPTKDDEVLYRTVLPKQFLEQAAPCGVMRTVVVEASPWVEDNAWLLDLAATNPAIIGVVGHLSPGTPDFAAHLERFAANRLYRGIRVDQSTLRHGQDRPEFIADIRRLADHGLELDVNGGPDVLPDVSRLAEKMPSLRIVINHLANTDVDGGPAPQHWLAGMRSAAKHPHVFCKVSALVEHAKPKGNDKKVPNDVAFYRPVLDAIWDTFGDDRLIYGSDWPVSDRFAPYSTLFSIMNQYVYARGRVAAEKFFATNAAIAYALPQTRA
ncbi:MAG: amidohydrolase family protein [Paludisphaera borealis]|uniref:amidohydrolase family protein n=1 Tax=Paludisphaera borealis TaxID=1387353 RepID=UPI002841E5F0|nr:amidohydrolase family protein [Paludisphaera borealis]MDR3618596.1 amidohydrolase family protein [Paludisphaera borealis]